MVAKTIQLSEELLSAIRRSADQTRRSEDDVIRATLEERFAAAPARPNLDFIGSVADGRIDGATSDDWLRDNLKPE